MNLDKARFQLVVAASVKCGPGWQLDKRSWPDHRILIIRGGSGQLVHRHGTQELRRGQVIFGLPGEEYGVLQNDRRRLIVSALRFRVFTAQQRVASLSEFRRKLCAKMECFPLLEQLALRLTGSISTVPCRPVQLADSLLRLILWLIQDDHEGGAHGDARNVALQELKPVLDLPLQPGKPEPSIDALARLCGMSTSTFRRRLGLCFGTSPKQFMLQRRINRAKMLLLESLYTVESIATELGYREPAHFSRQFKQHVGISPARFRTSNQ